MSDTTTETVETVDTPEVPVDPPNDDTTEAGQQQAGPDDAEQETEPEESGNAEAAKYRRRLRDTETQLAEANQRIEALQRQQVDALIEAAGVKPAAVWTVAQLDTLLTEEGTVSVEAVTAAIDEARNTLGITPIGKGNVVPGIGNQPANSLEPKDTWTEAFKPKARKNG